jgi:hypothetical protein
VDGTEDGLAVVGKLSKQCADGPSRLAVESFGGIILVSRDSTGIPVKKLTGRRLIKEQQQFRLGGKFNPDCQSLSLFNVQA